MKITGAELARILGLSKARVTQLKTEGVLTADSGGKYDDAPSIKAYIAHLLEAAADPALSAERRKYLAEQTRRLRLANDKQERLLIPLDDVKQITLAAMSLFIQALEGLPGRCAAEFAAGRDAAVIHDRLKSEIRSAREQMARGLGELAEHAVIVPEAEPQS